MRAHVRVLILIGAFALALAACENGDADDENSHPDDPQGYDVGDQPDAAAVWVAPLDNDRVASPVQVEMGATDVDIVPAGPSAVGEGHLHVLVDNGCANRGEVIPGPSEEAEADGYFHFDDGSTSGEIALEPGEYELCLQLGDGAHRAFGTTDVIQITVE